MKDAETTIGQMREKVDAFIKERDWEQFHHPRDLAISLSLEAAELLEHFQWEPQRPLEAVRKDGKLVRQLSEELSDILHYILNFANVLDIDLAAEFEKKMAKNAEKYPADMVRAKALRHNNHRPREMVLSDDEI